MSDGLQKLPQRKPLILMPHMAISAVFFNNLLLIIPNPPNFLNESEGITNLRKQSINKPRSVYFNNVISFSQTCLIITGIYSVILLCYCRGWLIQQNNSITPFFNKQSIIEPRPENGPLTSII